MEPNNLDVPENQPSIEPPKATSPYQPTDPSAIASTSPKLSGSSFQSRAISPLEPRGLALTSEHLDTPSDPALVSLTNQVEEPINPVSGPPPVSPDQQFASEPAATLLPAMPQVVSSDIISSTTPAQIPDAGPAPTAFISQEVPEVQLPPAPKRKMKLSKPILGAIAAFIIIAGGLGFYFGYYNNPSVIYSQSMNNSAKGYDKLVSYVDKQAAKSYKGSEGSGSFSIKASGVSTDGKLAFRSDDKAGQFTFDVGLGATRLTADARLIYVGKDSADVYIKAGGIKGLGTLAGVPAIDAQLAKLDDTWIVIDHTLLDTINQAAGTSSESSKSMNLPTQAQIMDEAEAFGKINKEYLFTTNTEKSVMQVTKKYGFETVQGRKTYHYQATLQKDNAKKYIDAQAAALKSSKMQSWLKANGLDGVAEGFFTSLKDSADTIKSTDTVDVWVDASQRIIYKVRFADKNNPVNNYLDVGLNYKGDDNFPFFLSGHSKDGNNESNFSLVLTLNTSTGNTDLKLDVKAGVGSESTTMGAKFSIKPSNANYKIEKPANAKQLAQVLSELGYGDLLTQLMASAEATASSPSGGGVYGGVQDKAKDSKRRADLASLQTQVEAFYAQNGYYPSLSEMNSAGWRKTNMKSLDPDALQDPDGSSQKLVISPVAKSYSYKVTDASGSSCESDSTKCAKYTMTATLSDGKALVKENLD